MLFKERSNALLPEKHCFFGNGEFVYTSFNIPAATPRPVLKKFRTLFDSRVEKALREQKNIAKYQQITCELSKYL